MPSAFGDDIIGHGTVLGLLGRWLDDPAPAYLFFGPAHAGKRTVAERFVKRLLGRGWDEETWKTHPDLVLLEPEEGKNQVSVEQVRNAKERLAMRPMVAPRVVAYVPAADRLNESGMNALLKVLEEPPAGAVFVLVAEDAGRVPLTVKSRSVGVPFSPVPKTEIVAALRGRGIAAADAERRAAAARGLPGYAIEPPDGEREGARFASRFLLASTPGERLEIVEDLVKTCDGSDDPVAAWRDALHDAADAVRTSLASDPVRSAILGMVLLYAERAVGSAVSPRLALDACAVRLADDPSVLRRLQPGHLPTAFPLIYTV